MFLNFFILFCILIINAFTKPALGNIVYDKCISTVCRGCRCDDHPKIILVPRRRDFQGLCRLRFDSHGERKVVVYLVARLAGKDRTDDIVMNIIRITGLICYYAVFYYKYKIPVYCRYVGCYTYIYMILVGGNRNTALRLVCRNLFILAFLKVRSY